MMQLSDDEKFVECLMPSNVIIKTPHNTFRAHFDTQENRLHYDPTLLPDDIAICLESAWNRLIVSNDWFICETDTRYRFRFMTDDELETLQKAMIGGSDDN